MARRDQIENPGEPVVRLLHKALAMDHAVELVKAGELKDRDVTVLWILCSSVDRQTGETTLRYQTIADKCGASWSTVARAVKRLRAAGVIEVRERYYKETGGRVANAYQLDGGRRERMTECRPKSAQELHPLRTGVRANLTGGSSHLCHGYSVSQEIHTPSGVPGHKNDEVTDWGAIESWLATAGRYDRWGYGYEQLAADDLGQMRSEIGDVHLLSAIKRAQERGLYGDVLISFLKKTYPGRRRRASEYASAAGPS